MLIILGIFFIISIILVFIISNKYKNIKNREMTISNNSLILSVLIYLVVAYFLSDFYSFNPLEVDEITGIKINPYVSFISLVLQYLNTLLLVDTWYKSLRERIGNKLSLYLLTIIYNIIVIIGLYLLYNGYTGTEGEIIYSNISFFKELSIVTLYIPFVMYDLKLLNIINEKKSEKL